MKSVNVYRKAESCYLDFCQNNCQIYNEPMELYSMIGRKYVHLADMSGPFARYLIKEERLHPDDIIKIKQVEIDVYATLWG
jgi:hypothetical protein